MSGLAGDGVRRHPSLAPKVVFPAAIAILIVLAYAPAWRFPFIQDDIGLFNWIGGQDLVGLWQLSPFGYYRPLTQVVWKLGELLAGRFDPVMLHWVNVAAHAMTALLVGYLAGQWLPSHLRWPGRWLAGALFALYPFTFQVVPFVGALYHPLVSLLILGTLAGHAAYRSSGSRAGWIASGVCAVLAPFAHEAGLLAGPLLIVFELVSARTQHRRPAWRILAWGAAAAAFGYLVWLSVPKSGPQTARPDLGGMVINLTYAVQGLTYPLGPLTQSIIQMTGWPDQSVILIGGACFVAVAFLVARRAGCQRAFGSGLLLWAAGALPFAVALVPRYVLAAAWLLYEQSIGATLVWSALLVGLTRLSKINQPPDHQDTGKPPSKLGVFVSLCLAIIILTSGLWFIRTRLAYYERLSDSVWDLGASMRAHPDSRAALVVNFPRLARPPERVFPIGVESPQFYGRMSSLRAALSVNGLSAPDEVQTLTFGNLIPPLDYSIETMGRDADWPDLASAIRSVDRVYRSDPGPDHIPVRYAGRRMEATSAAPLVQFDRSVALIDAEADLIGSDLLAITLRWQYAGGADDAVVFVHVLNGMGELLSQADGPVMGMLPFWQWPDDDQVEEVRYISLEATEAMRVNVGVYRPASGERLAPVDRDGVSYPDGSVPLFEIDLDAGIIHPIINRQDSGHTPQQRFIQKPDLDDSGF